MRSILTTLIILFTITCFSQSSQLAYSYFRKGEYEKAAVIYEKLHKKNPVRRDYFKNLIACYQYTSKYEKASELINNQIVRYRKHKYLLIEKGYNLQLQDKNKEATKLYEKAIESIEENPSLGYQIGKTFRDNHLLDYAIKAYKKAMLLNPNLVFDQEIAQVYGEKGEIEQMFNAYFDIVEKNDIAYTKVQHHTGSFLTDNSEDKNNVIFTKLLLKRLQNNPTNGWNKLLSWLFLQQKDYDKALVQEKAVHKRSNTSLNGIFNVGKIAFENQDYQTSKNAFKYITENTSDKYLKLKSEVFILKSEIETATKQQELTAIDTQFKNLLQENGYNASTLDLQIAYSDFLTFKKNNPESAINILNNALKNVRQFDKEKIKIKIADILVFTGQFNQALIKYSQAQTALRNSTLAHEARYKVARTSYFKGDFDWAKTQLKVLKGSTSQLIANDALELYLLISDNTAQDSTQIALKSFAKADLLAYQNKNKIAIDSITTILNKHPNHEIQDVALFKQAELYEKINELEKAENNYLKILTLKDDNMLFDNSYFKLAKLYENKLNNPEKAKEMYQKIIFEHPSSIFLVDARKRFRKLRGDNI